MKNIDFTRLETWLHGLFAASIMAGASTGGALLTSYIGQTAINWHQLEVSIGISSLIAAFFYLKSSPLPDLDTVTVTAPATNQTTVTSAPVRFTGLPTTQPIIPVVNDKGMLVVEPSANPTAKNL